MRRLTRLLYDESGWIKIDGLGAWTRRIQLLATELPEAMGRAMKKEMQIELQEVKKVTPTDTGALRASMHVVGPEPWGNHIRVGINVGADLPRHYAVYVHEDLEAFHDPPTGPKFLERTLRASRPFMGARVAKRMREELIG